MDEDEQYEDEVVTSWEKFKGKKDALELEAEEQLNAEMETLDALENLEASLKEQMWGEIFTWCDKNDVKYTTVGKDLGDVMYEITLKKTCGCVKDPDSYYFKVVIYSNKHNGVIDCADCNETLSVDETTIQNVKVTFCPKCIGCTKTMYNPPLEGEFKICDHCKKVYSNIHSSLNLNEGILTNYKLPLQGQILRRVSVLNGNNYDGSTDISREIVAEVKNANIITSEVAGTHDHKPVLDIDLGCKLIPSTNVGHYHLYIDKQMSWDKYKKLLEALKDGGIIEPGYYQAALARKYTGVRLPWIRKKDV